MKELLIGCGSVSVGLIIFSSLGWVNCTPPLTWKDKMAWIVFLVIYVVCAIMILVRMSLERSNVNKKDYFSGNYESNTLEYTEEQSAYQKASQRHTDIKSTWGLIRIIAAIIWVCAMIAHIICLKVDHRIFGVC